MEGEKKEIRKDHEDKKQAKLGNVKVCFPLVSKFELETAMDRPGRLRLSTKSRQGVCW